MISRKLAMIGALALLLGLAIVPPTYAAPDDARVRVVHASPDTGAVDVYVDGGLALENVSFFTASDYLSVPPGDRLIQVTPAGTDPATSSAISETVTLNPNAAYTAAATGLSTTLTPTLALTPIVDDVSAPGSGQARVAVYHFSPGAPAVDVQVVGGATPLITNLAFTEAEYVDVPAGTYDIEVVPNAGGAAVITLEDLELLDGYIYSIFAVDELASIRPEITAINSVSRVRFLHASPDAPAVDIYVDGQLELEDVAFGGYTSYIDFPAGTRQIQVTPANAPVGDAVLTATPTFFPEQAYTVAVTGYVSEGATPALGAALFEDDLSTPESGQARVNVYHLSPDAPAVNVQVPGSATPLFENLAFQEMQSTSVPTGTYDLEVVPAAGGDAVATLESLVLEESNIYSVFAINTADALELLVVITETTAQVRVVHASPDAPAVDVYVDGQLVLENVPFGAISDYLEVPAGERRIQITPTGVAPAADVIDATISVKPEGAYTLVASGELANIELVWFNEQLDPAPEGQSYLRVYHLSPSEPSVAVDVQVDGTDVITGLAYLQVSGYEPLESGTYTFTVTVAGTDDVVLTLDNVEIGDNGITYSIFVLGVVEDDTLTAAIKATGPGGTPPYTFALPYVQSTTQVE